MASNYWQRRALANRGKAERLAETYSQRQKKAYRDAYSELSRLASDLQSEVLYNGGVASRTQLWQYAKYQQLMTEIERQSGVIGAQQLSALDQLVQRVFEDTIGATMADIAKQGGPFNVVSEALLRQHLNTAWAGSNYSTRVWNNANVLAQRLKDDMSEMIVRGRNPMDIKRRLMQDLDVSYSVADRLIRTESMHTYNSAALETYRAAGVDRVEVLVSEDERLCPACAEAEGVYEVGKEPVLPVHPNCRCCYAAVVDLGEGVDAPDLTTNPKGDTMPLDDVLIVRGVGARGQNYKVMDLETGEFFRFAEGTRLRNVEAFAGKGTNVTFRKAEKYARKYGGAPEDWQHVKGEGTLVVSDGERDAEVHWVQCEAVGRHDFFVKRWLD